MIKMLGNGKRTGFSVPRDGREWGRKDGRLMERACFWDFSIFWGHGGHIQGAVEKDRPSLALPNVPHRLQPVWMPTLTWKVKVSP
jgi:hypothetical protein